MNFKIKIDLLPIVIRSVGNSGTTIACYLTERVCQVNVEFYDVGVVSDKQNAFVVDLSKSLVSNGHSILDIEDLIKNVNN